MGGPSLLNLAPADGTCAARAIVDNAGRRLTPPPPSVTELIIAGRWRDRSTRRDILQINYFSPCVVEIGTSYGNDSDVNRTSLSRPSVSPLWACRRGCLNVFL